MNTLSISTRSGKSISAYLKLVFALSLLNLALTVSTELNPQTKSTTQHQPETHGSHESSNQATNNQSIDLETMNAPPNLQTGQSQKPLHYLSEQFLQHPFVNDSSVIKVGYLTNIHGRYNQQRQGIIISGAITYAITKINKDSSRFNGRRLELIANDTEGKTIAGTTALINQWRQGAVAFFGPEDSCEVEAAVAAAINLPMISYKCADSKASNKNFYKTFVRTHPPDTQIVSSVIALLRYFRWQKFSIISEKTLQYQNVARNLADRARASNLTINTDSKFENIYACCVEHRSCCHDSLYNIIEETFRRTRIYVFLGTVNDLISLLQVMQVKNLINNGYMIIYIDLEQYNKSFSYKYFWRLDMDSGTKRTMIEAAKSLLVIVSSPPNTGTYSDFEENVRVYNTLPPFNFSQPFDNFKKHITIYASYLYDALMLYADALDDTIKEGADISDGAAIVQRIIKRRNYQSITGSWMNIDSNGDVEGNYSVLALMPTPSDVKLKVSDDFNYTMYPIGSFYKENDTLWLEGTIDWATNWTPPLDEPVCAYDGSLCKKPNDFSKEKIAIIEFSILITLSVIVFQVYRNWKKEQEITGLLWRMDPDEIQIHNEQLNRAQSRSSFASQLSNDSAGFRNRNVYTKTATYKGIIVAIKELQINSKKDKDIPRASQVEMKLLKEIRHDNINQFIGACIKNESNLIYIVTEYCAKGSLLDVLNNPDVKLDQMFISSLVFDLLYGLNYLHNSELKCHGNLKSSNCLITSRWVLKITDFGLHNFRKKASTFQESERCARYRDQLWKAPELLRNPTMLGNQKTDVYAFAIILHEIIGREGPFGIDRISMRARDVINSVVNPKAGLPNRVRIEQHHNRLNRQATSGVIASPEKLSGGKPTRGNHTTSRNNSQLDLCGLANHRSNNLLQQSNHSGIFMNLDDLSEAPELVPLNYEKRSYQNDIKRKTVADDYVGESDSNVKPSYKLGPRMDLTHQVIFRPDVSILQCPSYIVELMQDCWAEKPDVRPDIRTIRRRLQRLRQGNAKYNIMDNMIAMMEKYAHNLEEIVQDRTAQLSEEKKKTEVLLYRMLPPSVASQLMVGEEVEPESFDAVTIFFSDIVGFTEMSSKSTPMEVVVFLNDLYTLFDAILRKYNVYKVETIGDAYMVVSGLPERISDHASEIATMAIELLRSVENFRIRHLQNEILQLRIGLHTGPVVAGVVGTMMPRYCLFGDTVNTASRMESHGEPLKIHTSPRTKDHLDRSGNYVLESRGLVNIKGKGNLETFWLLGFKDETSQYRLEPSNKSENVGLFDAIGQIEGKKRSPRVGHGTSEWFQP